jgi:hypothetical protein
MPGIYYIKIQLMFNLALVIPIGVALVAAFLIDHGGVPARVVGLCSPEMNIRMPAASRPYARLGVHRIPRRSGFYGRGECRLLPLKAHRELS